MQHRTFLRLKPAKTEEATPEAQLGILSALLSIGKRSFVDRLLWRQGQVLSFELVSIDQKTRFYLNTPPDLGQYFSSQILSQYPKTFVEAEQPDPAAAVIHNREASSGWLSLVSSYHFPLKTYNQVSAGHWPLASLIGFMGKLEPQEAAMIQILLRVPANQSSLQTKIRSSMKSVDSEGVEHRVEHANMYEEKLKAPLLEAQIRILLAHEDAAQVAPRIRELAGVFGVYTQAEGNSLVPKIHSGKKHNNLLEKIATREFYFWQPTLILNLHEAASLWHLPGKDLEQLKGVDWGKTLLFEAPDNLPVSEALSDDQKPEVNFFGKTEWRNREAIFGLKREDRRRHMYVIGKTGAGKSTLIANMAINDIRNGEGVAVIDPHGDLSEMILDFIPKRRIPDVVYLDPSLSDDRSFTLHLFDKQGAAHTDVVASGIVSVFHKLYHYSWGPRLEYILRNSVLSLLLYGQGTFADLPRLLTNPSFRAKVVEKVAQTDPVLSAFWREEYDQMNDRLRTEAISPVLNKVGQFLSSHLIRNILSQQSSSFSFEEVMNQKKILILNLSQGKLGEDTAALLGAMFITKMQLTAMNRVHLPEDQRPDFYLYVDEFQNFATSSFVKILSEARKYRLNLMLANQYIGQVDEDIQKAIFGNVGSLATFVVGARDAELLSKEFGSTFEPDDLVGLGKYQILLKMAIDGLTSNPFMAMTLPLPNVVNHNREKIIRVALEKYYRKV